jgi:hypothetical protein
MANLLGENIGTNYKGILNLNTLNGNLSATLQAVTDGDGNTSPLNLATGSIQFGSTTGLFWDNANNRLGVGTNAPSRTLTITGDGARIRDLNIGVSSQTAIGNTSNIIMNIGSVGFGFTSGSVLTAAAMVHVRGDGTNPVFRGESNAGANFVSINNSGQLFFGSAGANEPYIVNFNGVSTESGAGSALRIRQRANINGTLIQYWADGLFNNTTSGTNISHHFLSSGYAGAAGNGNYRATQIEYTINNSGAQTGTGTGIFLNATETNLNSMTHNLIDLQRGGVSQFLVDRVGALTTVGNINGQIIRSNSASTFSFNAADTGMFYFNSRGGLRAPSNGVFTLLNTAETDFSRLQFGGTTSSFPAIKRNGAAIDFRLADDSAACGTNASSFNTASVTVGSNFIVIGGDAGLLRPAASTLGISLNGFTNNHFEFKKNSDATVVGIIKGTGDPEGVITANAGSIFLRTDGSALSTFYVKQSGAGNTGWAAIA